MKKLGLTIGAVALVTALFCSTAFAKDIVKSKALTVGNFRLAVADRACPIEGEPGYEYLISVCNRHKTVGNYCGCLTAEEELLQGEMDPADIPDAAFRRVGVCEWVNEDGQTVQTLEWLKINEPLPAHLDPTKCKLISDRILNWRISHRATKTQLFQALESKCCAACLDTCWIQPGTWKACPRCLLDSTPTCESYCPIPE